MWELFCSYLKHLLVYRSLLLLAAAEERGVVAGMLLECGTAME